MEGFGIGCVLAGFGIMLGSLSVGIGYGQKLANEGKCLAHEQTTTPNR